MDKNKSKRKEIDVLLGRLIKAYDLLNEVEKPTSIELLTLSKIEFIDKIVEKNKDIKYNSKKVNELKTILELKKNVEVYKLELDYYITFNKIIS